MNRNKSIELRYNELEAKVLISEGNKCDRYDYLIASFCGFASGLVDSLFVGKPNFREEVNSSLGTISDVSANKITSLIADKLIEHDETILNSLQKSGLKGEMLSKALEEKGVPGNFKRNGVVGDKYPDLAEKITYLENKFRVSYDQSTNDKIIGSSVNITPDNHHLKSLSHSPDVFGLCFAILDQFTQKTSFVENGKVIRVVPAKQGVDLLGTDFVSKLFCAIVNWLGHLLSDFCGSHSSKGRGDGIPIPFFELFEFCDFGSFAKNEGNGEDSFTIADLAMKVYENGYDARHGAATAIPLIMSDLMISFIWAIKSHFVMHKPWGDCVPNSKYSDLRVMKLVGNLTLCAVDGTDALIRSNSDVVSFCLHLNYIAWFRLLTRGFKEFELRCGFEYEDLKTQYEYIEQQLEQYTEKLKSIDYAGKEHMLSQIEDINLLKGNSDIFALDEELTKYMNENGIDIKYNTDEEFYEFMLNDDEPFIL